MWKSCREKNDAVWRDKSCKEILNLNSVINSFKANPTVPTEICANFSTKTENDKMIEYRYQVVEILLECQKEMVQFDKLGMLFLKFIENVEMMLAQIHNGILLNEDNLNKRSHRTFHEKKYEDCPQALLQVENKKLKEYKCLLNYELKSLKNHYEKLNLVQYKTREYVNYLRNKTKMLEKRFQSKRITQLNSLYCNLEGAKLTFSKRDMQSVIYNFCARVCEMEDWGSRGRTLLQTSQERVTQIWNNKKTIFDVVNRALCGKLDDLKNLSIKLTEALDTNRVYRKVMLKRLNLVVPVRVDLPNCQHVKKYDIDTTASLNRLEENYRRLNNDNDGKKHASITDKDILHQRAYASHFI